MKTLEYFSDVKDGKLQPNVSRQIQSDLKEFEGKRVLIKLSQKRKNRSMPQNRYYFGVVCEAFQMGAKDTWGEDVSKEEAHENLKKECNYKEFLNDETGEILRLSKTTADLTTLAFEDYIERCRQFIYTWFGVTVPMPNEQAQIEFEA